MSEARPVITDEATILAIGGASDLPTRVFCSNLTAGVLFVWNVPFDCTLVRIIASGSTLIVSRVGSTTIPTNPDFAEYICVTGGTNVVQWVNVVLKTKDKVYFYLSANPGNVAWTVTQPVT